MAFTVVLLTLVACFMVDVVNCNTFCEGMSAIRCSVTINACEAPSYSYCMVCGEICRSYDLYAAMQDKTERR